MSSEKNTKEVNENQVDSLELIAIAKRIWLSKRLIIKSVIVMTLIGVFIALSSQKSYKVETIMIPNSNESGGAAGSLGGLASLAGINLGAAAAAGAEIPPKLYPQIMNSLPFQQDMMRTGIYLDGDSTSSISYEEYQIKRNSENVLAKVSGYTIGLPSTLLKLIRGEAEESTKQHRFITLSESEKEVIKNLENQMTISVNDLDGTITLEVNMPDAMAAVILAERALVVLQQKVTELKVKKAQEELDFKHSLYMEKKAEFDLALSKLSSYRDRNKNIVTFSARNELDRLEADYNLSLGVYTEVAKQLEAAKIKIKEDTPSFSVLQPAILPNIPTKPRKLVIILGSAFLGLFTGVILILCKMSIAKIKENW